MRFVGWFLAGAAAALVMFLGLVAAIGGKH